MTKGQRNSTIAIKAQNSVHCKTCDIKNSAQNINWTARGTTRNCEEAGGRAAYLASLSAGHDQRQGDIRDLSVGKHS
jgi:Electron transfer flavoprotein-ubiquinone oxidoreductase, 4Fe-4S